LLMQMQSDVLGKTIKRAASAETTALGAAVAAGVGAGLWTAAEALGVVKGDGTGDNFVPQRDMEEVEGEYAAWMRAVETVMGMSQT